MNSNDVVTPIRSLDLSKESQLTSHSDAVDSEKMSAEEKNTLIEQIRGDILHRVAEKKNQQDLKSIFYEKVLISLCKLFTGLSSSFIEPLPEGPCIFYANHQSHLDGLALWSSLPKQRRIETHPIAAKSYWQSSKLKQFIASDIFNALLIDREKETRQIDPILLMSSLLNANQSLIFFPEGTRGEGDVIHPFKSGLYHLAKSSPNIPIIPVYLHNLHRVMPKGSKLIVPILCDVRFGKPLFPLSEDDGKEEFLSRAKSALEELKYDV